MSAEMTGASITRSAPATVQMAEDTEPTEADLVAHARAANDQGNWPEAARRWRLLVERFPQHVLARASLVNALTAMRRYDDAETQAQELLQRHPLEARARWAAAWSAHQQESWRIAATRWQDVLDIDRDDIPAVCCHITALTNDRRYDEAVAAAQVATERFGDNSQVAESVAWISHKKNDWPLAAMRWRRVTQLDPENGTAYACLAAVLRAVNDHVPAEKALLRAIEIFPDRLSFRTDHALAAEQRGDALEAQRRWQDLRRRYSDDPAALQEIERHRPQEVERADLAGAAPAVAVSDTGARALLMHVESIGDNGEFGMLQRRYGAEPLGLLRFASISLPNLIDGLGRSFSDVGDPELMEIEVLGNGEYVVHDAYGIEQLTFVHRHELSRERFAAQIVHRYVSLRDKLMNDLRAGEKLFLYRTDKISIDDALALHGAMRNHGRADLLCVMKADPYHPAGSVETVRNGLMVGYVSRFAGLENFSDCEAPEWLSICRAASAIRAHS